jgi:hypothetical protein
MAWDWEQGLPVYAGRLAAKEGVTSPFVIVARNSGQSGKGPIAAVRTDMLEGCRAFAEICGVDLSPLVPSVSKLTTLFRSAEVIRSRTREGAPFTHRILEVDFRRSAGAYFVFVLGSGRKVDDSLRQPAVVHITDVVRRIEPSILWASSISRIGRIPWELGHLAYELDYCGAFLGDRKRGLHDALDNGGLSLFIEGMHGFNEAVAITERTRTKMVQHVNDAMVEGVAVVGAMSPHPAGICRLRMRDELRNGQSVLVFDNAAGLPRRDAVAYGYPEVYDENGEHIDQVALVRRALSQFGKRSRAQIGAELIADGFSTQRARSDRGPAARYIGYRPSAAAEFVLKHLGFYRTGELPVNFGFNDQVTTVSGFFPPDGPWASPEDFERIDALLADEKAKRRSVHRTTFGGLRVTANRIPSQLVPYSQGFERYGGLVYRVVPLDSKAHKNSVHHGLIVSHDDLVKMLVDGVKRAGEDAWDLLDIPRSHPAALDAELARLEAREHGIEAEMKALRSQLDERDPSGNRIIIGALLAAVTEDYEHLARDLASTTDQISAVRDRIDAADAASIRNQATTSAAAPLIMLSTLDDPRCTLHQTAWRNALQDLEITATTEQVRSMRGCSWTISGHLHLGTGDRLARVPLSASRSFPAERADEKVDEIVEALRAGYSIDRCPVGCAEDYLAEVSERLGLPRSRRSLLWCRDPRILTIAMRLGPDGEDITSVTDATGEPTELVARIQDRYWTNPTQRWNRSPSPVATATAIDAHRHSGRVPRAAVDPSGGIEGHRRFIRLVQNEGWSDIWTYDRTARIYVCSGCPHCGAQALARMLTPDPDRWVCLSCERDRSGTLWLLRIYAPTSTEPTSGALRASWFRRSSTGSLQRSSPRIRSENGGADEQGSQRDRRSRAVKSVAGDSGSTHVRLRGRANPSLGSA